MGDLLAAFPLDVNLIQGPAEFGEIFTLLQILFFQEIFNPAGLLHHDRHRIVDFMGHAGGQLSHRGQLAGFDDLLVHHLFFLIEFRHLAHHFFRENQSGDHNGQAPHQNDQNRNPLGTTQVRKGVRGILLIDQQPVFVFQKGPDINVLLTGIHRPLQDVDPVGSSFPSLDQLIQLLIFTVLRYQGGFSLEFSFPVEDQGEAGSSDAKVFHQGIERIEIDGGSKQPVLSFVPAADTDDEMRLSPKPQKDLADVIGDFNRPLKPFGIRVIGPPQRIGSGVAHLPALFVDDPQVFEYGAVFPPKIFKHLIQKIIVGQFFKGE